MIKNFREGICFSEGRYRVCCRYRITLTGGTWGIVSKSPVTHRTGDCQTDHVHFAVEMVPAKQVFFIHTFHIINIGM